MKIEKSLLKKVTSYNAVSGSESKFADFIKKELKGHAKLIKTDALGNLIFEKKGSGKGPKIMVAAHMDEVGLMVKYVEDKGALRFIKIGGIDDTTLVDQKVIVHSSKKDYVGVIGSKPPHLKKKDEPKKILPHTELFVDVGAKDKKDVSKLGIEKGDPISFYSEPMELPNENFCSKALDNKLGVFILITLLKKIKNFKGTLYGVFSVQEEVGLKGARTSAFSINPDIALAVDTTIAGDTPGITPQETDLKLGKGPAITVIEASGIGAIVPESLKKFLINLSKSSKIPYQMEVVEGGMTDAAIIQLTREGILTGVLSVPCRYLHTPNSICNVKDIERTIDLLTKFVSNAYKVK